MSLPEILVSAIIIIGACVMLTASIGLLRFGDVYLRMHAATKASTLGICLIILGVGVFFTEPLVIIKLLALGAIYFLVSATGAQVLASASHAIRMPMVKETWIDELAEKIAEQDAEEAEIAQNAKQE